MVVTKESNVNKRHYKMIKMYCHTIGDIFKEQCA